MIVSRIRNAMNNVNSAFVNSNPSIQNKEMTVKYGEIFEISLPSNPTTGYEWNVILSPGLLKINEKYDTNCKQNMVGCGGVKIWTLRAVRSGKESFNGSYKRSWEAFPAEVVNYNITVM